ncbi:hypothetical protein [Dermacoccus sp. GAS27A]|uniref:hypothetical protein n=1 Tax=Dermacoccus sp. GAS27A TaxID=3156270 RepID=UPI003837463F
MTSAKPPTPSMRASGACAGAVASAAICAASFAPVTLIALVFVVLGCGLACGWPRLVNLPSPRGTTFVLTGTAVALAVTMLASGAGDRTRWAGAVLCVGLIASFLHQLLREDGRPRLVMTLAGTALGLGVLGAGAYFIDAADSSQTRHLMLATGLATLVGSVLDGVAGATSRRLELGAAQCVLGAIAGCGAVIAGASVASAALAGGAAGLLSWACLRTTVTLATSAHTRAQFAAGCACVLVCGLVPVAVARLV